MRILHSYCLNFNIGDYYLGIGVKNLFRDNVTVDYFGDTNLQGRVFDEYYIKEVVNKRYDLLVIGGGGIIHGAHWPNGWFWIINKNLIKEIKIPFIIYGVGYNYFEGEKGIPARGIEHLKETMKYATYFSVRNDGSAKRLLDQTGIVAPVIPDPGFHVDLNCDYDNPEKEVFVVIQLANDKPEHRFYGQGAKQFVIEMRGVIETLTKKYKVILAPHVPDDVSLSHEVVAGIDNADVWDFGYYAFDHSAESLGYYQHAKFVLAMRGHGQIVPICFNTPVIMLENHPKHRGLMVELDLLEYNVKVNQPNLGKQIRQLIEKLELDYENLVLKYNDINRLLKVQSKESILNIKRVTQVVLQSNA
tara:strand:- start:27953 stop:29032 length:1080 start_codon:yes stop_codon:yes gene_type:complete